jgi:hypothetical protein
MLPHTATSSDERMGANTNNPGGNKLDYPTRQSSAQPTPVILKRETRQSPFN